MRYVFIVAALLFGFLVVFVPGYFFHIRHLTEEQTETTPAEKEDVSEVAEDPVEIAPDPGDAPEPVDK